MAVLAKPVVLLTSALCPMAVLSLPVVLFSEPLTPRALLREARGVANERIDSAGGVEAARGVANERIESAGGVGEALGVASERLDSAGGVESPVVLIESALDSDGRVDVACGVEHCLPTRLDHTCPTWALPVRSELSEKLFIGSCNTATRGFFPGPPLSALPKGSTEAEGYGDQDRGGRVVH